jgi:hypothetical protein
MLRVATVIRALGWLGGVLAIGVGVAITVDSATRYPDTVSVRMPDGAIISDTPVDITKAELAPLYEAHKKSFADKEVNLTLAQQRKYAPSGQLETKQLSDEQLKTLVAELRSANYVDLPGATPPARKFDWKHFEYGALIGALMVAVLLVAVAYTLAWVLVGFAPEADSNKQD